MLDYAMLDIEICKLRCVAAKVVKGCQDGWMRQQQIELERFDRSALREVNNNQKELSGSG